MRHRLSHPDLVRILPGSWRVAATNFPFWLTAQRLDPTLNYELISENPLTLADVVEYVTDDGETKRITGVDRARDGEFTWRGRGLLKLLRGRWHITGVDENMGIMGIRYGKTLATPAGIDIVVRDGAVVPDVRTIVATGSDAFGLTLEDFASLTWLDRAA